MATPESPEPSRLAKAAVEFAVLGTTVVAIIALSLVFGGDVQTRIWTTISLTIALLIVAFSYGKGFERLSVAVRKRRVRNAIARHPDLLRRLEALAKEAGHTFGSQTKIYSWSTGAGVVTEAARRRQQQAASEPGGQRAPLPGIERIEEVVQLWSYLSPHWNITSLEVIRLCQGPARKDSQTFVDAMVLMNSLLKMAYWVVYRILNTAGQIAGLTPTQSERERWTTFRNKVNTLFDDCDALIRETNTAFGTDLTPVDDRISDPW